MNNGSKWWTLGMAACLAGGVMAFAAVEPEKKPQPPAGDKQPAMDAEMEKWMKAAMPNENHKLLEQLAGTWDAACTFWMEDGKEDKSTGTMTNTMVFDGRFIKEEYSGSMMGMPFKGLGYWGYDNLQKKFISTWMDSLGTMIMFAKGDYSSADKTWTMHADFNDPDGKKCHSKNVTRIVDKDHWVMEFWGTKEGEKERKEGEIKFTRKH